jgi:hypothetical protein
MKREHYLRASLAFDSASTALSRHYQHELDSFDETYRSVVYRGVVSYCIKSGLAVAVASIRLGESGEPRCEGDLTLVMDVDGQYAAFMSYSFVDAACFGLPSGTALFVTRNQLMPALSLFRRYYPNHSPQYFCLAPLPASRWPTTSTRSWSSELKPKSPTRSQYQAGFRQFDTAVSGVNSARALSTVQAYVLDLPLTPPSLDSVASKHRARAIERRKTLVAHHAASRSSYAGTPHE